MLTQKLPQHKYQPDHHDPDYALIEQNLLAWYDLLGRHLPWRVKNADFKDKQNPYYVWISEIMLQQTTVAAVKPYFLDFIEKFPNVHTLANADIDQVLHQWQGLGYYSRAHNLHKCANIISTQYGGVFPTTSQELLYLPGIGPYTSAAIASIAFDEPILPVDGNIIRVVSRILNLHTPLPALKAEVENVIHKFIPSHRSGDFAQALMDLGATICKPQKADCHDCPLQIHCKGYEMGTADNLPIPAQKTPKITRKAIILWIINNSGEVLIRKRTAKGLLHGLMEFPSTPWQTKQGQTKEDCDEQYMIPDEILNKSVPTGKTIKHVFTHFTLLLELRIYQPDSADDSNQWFDNGMWVNVNDLNLHAFPNLMKKVIASATQL